MAEETREQLAEYLSDRHKDIPSSLLDDFHPIDVARAMEALDDEHIRNICDRLDDSQLADLLENADDRMQTRLITLWNYERIIRIFSHMSKDDITDILGNLRISVRKELLGRMRLDDSKALTQLLGYREDTAGGIMTTEYIALKGRLPVQDALNKIKTIGPRTEVIETIFITDDRRTLIGTADLRDIFTAPAGATLADIMDDHVIRVHPDDDQEDVARLVSKYDLNVVPVVSSTDALLGIITVDDIIDVILEEQTEDILQMGGVSKEERIDSSFVSSVKKRLPWLYVNLATAFIASFTIGLFEDVIAKVIALSAAMSIVAGMGGNAGTQTLSVVIRSIALGEIRPENSKKLLLKEILLGIANGAAIGVVTGIILYFRYGNPYLGLIIFAAMVGNLLLAGCFGFLIPLILKALGADPALASAIFLTTVTDVGGFFLFLGLAKLFLPYLT